MQIPHLQARGGHCPGLYKKILLRMKMTMLMLLAAALQVSAAGYGQINISEKNASLQKVFRQIGKQSGYGIIYSADLLSREGNVSVNIRNATLEQALDICLKDKGLGYSIVEKTVVIKALPAPVATVKPEEAEKAFVKIIGVVVDEENNPVAGASVSVKGSTKGAVTNANGVFELDGVEENIMLVISGANIETTEFRTGASNRINRVTVRRKISQLEETQIIGYGKTTRRLKTGSVSSLKAEAIEKQPVTNPIQALQGRVAGVAITQTSGAIGSGMEIQVRGVNTIQSGNQPLVILDGAILPDVNRGLGTAIGAYMSWGSTSMNALNPNDIESIEILKDADATAIYGSRGANGVILITTKKAKLGNTRVNVDMSTWLNSATYLPKRMRMDQYLEMRRDAFAIGNYNPTTGVAINPIATNANNAPDLTSWNLVSPTTDWVDYEFGNRAPAVNVQANVSGGDKRLNFFASGGYLKQRDITRGAPYQERISGTLSVSHASANDRFRVTLNTSYIFNKLKPSRGGGTGGALQSMPPNMPMFNPDGTPWWPAPNISQASFLVSPVNAEEARTENITNNFIANVDASYRILKGLVLKAQVGYNNQGFTNKSQTPSTAINPLNPGSTVPNATWNMTTFSSINIEPQLTYNTNIGRGKLDALLGTTFFDRRTTSNVLQFDGYTSDLLLGSWAAASGVSNRTNSSTFYRFNSVFGRLNYNWDNKYLLNLTWRTDGSSRFGPKRQWGNFAAVGAGWIFTNEGWLKNKLGALSYGKIRGSYGTTGNDNIADYRFTSLYSPNFYNGLPGLSPSYLSDSSVGWETSKKLDLALELGFFKDRVLITANWFRNITTDLLVSTPVPSQTGFTSFITNIPAVVENRGWEFELTTRNVESKSGFQWRTTFNLSLLRNRLTEFPDLEKSAFANRLKIGLPINSPRYPLNAEWSQVYEGVDPATGLPRFTDLNKDGLINNLDRTYIGSAIPRTFGGFGNTFSYKGFELDIFFQFSRQLTTNWMFLGQYIGQLANPIQQVYGNYWKQPGDSTLYPRLFNGAVSNATTNLLSNIYPTSSATLVDLLYGRLKNLSLTYTLPTALTSKWKMSRVAVYIRGQNLLTWTSEPIYKDPELISLRGGQMLKTWAFGLNLTF